MVWAGLLKESLEVIGRQPCLTQVTVHGSHHVPHARVACLPIVVIVVVGCGHSQLRTLPTPLLATLGALPGALDGDVE
jgi:hypothetical protein